MKNVFGRLFYKTYTFQEAIQALKEGKKIRRKAEKKGYVKAKEGEGFDGRERYVTYWIEDAKTFEYCLFSLEDVFAHDWLIDD